MVSLSRKQRPQQNLENSDQNTMKCDMKCVLKFDRPYGLEVKINCKDKNSKLIHMGRMVIVGVV